MAASGNPANNRKQQNLKSLRFQGIAGLHATGGSPIVCFAGMHKSQRLIFPRCGRCLRTRVHVYLGLAAEDKGA